MFPQLPIPHNQTILFPAALPPEGSASAPLAVPSLHMPQEQGADVSKLHSVGSWALLPKFDEK